MTTHDPLRTMRDEMARELESSGLRMLERWIAALDAHLAVKRCPACGTVEVPIMNANQHYTYTTCGAMRCDRQAEGANDEEALAKFYAPVEVEL